MNSSRRSFLRNSAFGLGALAFASPALQGLAAVKYKKLVGVQLYSVRDDMRKDPQGTLNALAEMGYKYVEHANYMNRKFYGWEAKEFRKRLDDLGMKMPSGHTVMGKAHWDDAKNDFTDLWKYTVEDAAIMGQELVISPSIDMGIRKDKNLLLKYMEIFNKSGELCNKSGMRFGYHNHDFEFSEKLEGELLYDIMLNNTDPKLVAQQLDIGNMINGGGVPAEVMKKFPGRFVSMHVKDEVPAKSGHEHFESTVLGKGSGQIDVQALVKLGDKEGGTKHFIIEQEAYQGLQPLECMKENIAIMRGWGYK
ncbi:sugar phosphate isomerase/epimerase family protein [Aquirufa regiilacus]|uniref:TIM barrel protein n=1 Tax=Aquirufa regiilacus TaxID=3024868 RepID=A0ABU3TPF9_9BACT|nr:MULTISPECIES: TIM barrel protein [unclassified Aquirufa]MDT8886972.1 TIM barrel protein [Aquirufa sp. LEPPI-3A]MDU0807751.1 TIM barrel protein [Aquirufa sp. LEOWEIH-7C]